MDNRKMRICWSISILVIAAVTLFIVGCRMLDVEIPDAARIVLGICDLAALPVLVYTSIKVRIWKNNRQENK